MKRLSSFSFCLFALPKKLKQLWSWHSEMFSQKWNHNIWGQWNPWLQGKSMRHEPQTSRRLPVKGIWSNWENHSDLQDAIQVVIFAWKYRFDCGLLRFHLHLMWCTCLSLKRLQVVDWIEKRTSLCHGLWPCSAKHTASEHQNLAPCVRCTEQMGAKLSVCCVQQPPISVTHISCNLHEPWVPAVEQSARNAWHWSEHVQHDVRLYACAVFFSEDCSEGICTLTACGAPVFCLSRSWGTSRRHLPPLRFPHNAQSCFLRQFSCSSCPHPWHSIRSAVSLCAALLYEYVQVVFEIFQKVHFSEHWKNQNSCSEQGPSWTWAESLFWASPEPRRVHKDVDAFT